MVAAHAGRRGRPWRRQREQILAESDICVWCGHGGAKAVNHNEPWSTHPHLRAARSNHSPIHGIEGCPTCPLRWSKRLKRMARRVCNSELSNQPLAEALAQRAAGSRDW